MAALKVEAVKIPEVLERLRENAWQVPSFQRDFVWSEADVVNLVGSIIEARPIGMATLWEQPDDSDLHLESVSIPDGLGATASSVQMPGAVEGRPNQFYGILDGRQRCTALAMAFGGMKAGDKRRKFAGRFYLDVTKSEITEQIVYKKDTEIASEGLITDSACFSRGLFPLSSTANEKELLPQWMGYLQAVKDPSNYPSGKLPHPEELEKRNQVLHKAFQGINGAILAVYTVPAEYSLQDICEIFETLNTTGTKVSTVDLLHSWLTNDTKDRDEPFQLRDWIEDLGQYEGAIGWASKAKRPELIAQCVTLSYVALDSEKPAPRKIGRRAPSAVTSVKAGDLLATPHQFWEQVESHTAEFASYLGGFQKATTGASFPLDDAPYPVSSALYVGLRWYMDHDARYRGQWSVQDLDALFRAFFWRNALTTRYDQGFLTQVASDLKTLKETLFLRAEQTTFNGWAQLADNSLDRIMRPIPDQVELAQSLLEAKPAGALGKAYILPLRTRPSKDLLDPSTKISYSTSHTAELHHIYPKAWANSNQHGNLAKILTPNPDVPNYVQSPANLTPLTRASNTNWRAKAPGQALRDARLTYGSASERLESHFISEPAFEALTADAPDPLEFWTARAGSIAKWLVKACHVNA